MVKLFLVMAMLLGLAGNPAHAAQAGPEAAPASPSPQALALIRRVINALHVEESMAPMMNNIMQVQVQQIVAQNPKLTDQQKRQIADALGEVVTETLKEGMMSELMEKFIPVYAEVFSEDELRAMAEFYESPVGQSIMRKMPLMGPQAGRIAAEEMPRIQAAMNKKFQAKMEAMNGFGK